MRDLFIDRNLSIYALKIFCEVIAILNDQSESLLITFRNLILAKFMKRIKLCFTLDTFIKFCRVKKIKDQIESGQSTRI